MAAGVGGRRTALAFLNLAAGSDFQLCWGARVQVSDARICAILCGMKAIICRQPALASIRLASVPTLAIAAALLFGVACSAGAAPDDAAPGSASSDDATPAPDFATSSGASYDDADAVYDFPIILYQGADAVDVAAMGGSVLLMLSDLRGQPVVLNFWAGLCPPCRAEMPEFQRFADEYAGRALVVGVDLGQFFRLGSQDEAKALLNDLGVSYPAGYTDDASVVRELLITNLPATLFITADGVLHRKWIGVLNEAKLAEIADEMLAQ